MRWELADYADLTTGGRFYWLRPRSLKARLRWWLIKAAKEGQ